jgi:hypothetical protein
MKSTPEECLAPTNVRDRPFPISSTGKIHKKIKFSLDAGGKWTTLVQKPETSQRRR